MPRIRATAGDTGRTIGIQLVDDGTGRDLTTVDAIECHMRNRATGVNVEVTGLVGDANGNVPTELPTLTEGSFTLEWQVTADGGDEIATYPDDESDLVVLDVRAEAD